VTWKSALPVAFCYGDAVTNESGSRLHPLLGLWHERPIAIAENISSSWNKSRSRWLTMAMQDNFACGKQHPALL
jgi:hypothetical protein